MKNVDIEIGKIIREYRNDSELSQMELSEKLGYATPQFVSLFERGIARVPLETLGKLVVILGIPEDAIRQKLVTAAVTEISHRIKAGKTSARRK